MKASTQYTDFKGTVAADISDSLGGNDLSNMYGYFKLDEERFELIGLSLYGTENLSVSLLCIDKQRSTDSKNFIVKMMVDDVKENILEILFKRLHIILHNKYDTEYLNPELSYDEEGMFSDFVEEEE